MIGEFAETAAGTKLLDVMSIQSQICSSQQDTISLKATDFAFSSHLEEKQSKLLKSFILFESRRHRRRLREKCSFSPLSLPKPGII